tara:strand:- start:43 stop:363 length:321 start_codon:yes stop_codon:yes gene_type:complete
MEYGELYHILAWIGILSIQNDGVYALILTFNGLFVGLWGIYILTVYSVGQIRKTKKSARNLSHGRSTLRLAITYCYWCIMLLSTCVASQEEVSVCGLVKRKKKKMG